MTNDQIDLSTLTTVSNQDTTNSTNKRKSIFKHSSAKILKVDKSCKTTEENSDNSIYDTTSTESGSSDGKKQPIRPNTNTVGKRPEKEK